LAPTKIKNVFPLAQKKGCSFVALMGEEELEKGSVQLKNLTTAQQREFPLQNLEEMASFIKG
jgi:histidyl-tRNA synthetase